MSDVTTRPALLSDLPRLVEIYNHYILNTAITFNTQPFTLEGFAGWFQEHSDGKRHRLVVAVDDGSEGRLIGYAGTARFRPKEAYETTVETTIYCSPESTQRGVGTLLYRALFDLITGEDINRIVAGITLPNPASVALHERFGFRHGGTVTGNGRKFGKYWDVAWFERPLKVGQGQASKNRSRGNNGSFFRHCDQFFSAGVDHHRAPGRMDRGRGQSGSGFRVSGKRGDRDGWFHSRGMDFLKAGDTGRRIFV